MKPGQRLWTRQELILAINLYCKLPFSKINRLNTEIIQLSGLIDRTPSSVALKLANFASLDPSLKARGIKGASNASKLDAEIWHEFFNNWENLAYESEMLLASFQQTSAPSHEQATEVDAYKEGEMRAQQIKVRVNQSFFRSTILASYNNTCCITGLQQPEFLIAGHIKPWSVDAKNRLNPRNGIAINALHDKAFEAGLLTITPDYKVKISPVLFKQRGTNAIDEYFLKFENQDIHLPSRFLPDVEFLKYHNEVRFRY